MAGTVKKWMAKAFANSHGQLHKDLNVAPGKKIPAAKEEAAAAGAGKTAKRAQAALNARRANGY